MTNKTILYLHGLGGSPDNKAIEQLKTDYNVIAPKLNYFKKTTWDSVNNMVENNQIDLIIGFSLGGYMAYYLSNKYQIPALLFNPAFKAKYANLVPIPADIKEIPTYGQQTAVIGQKDDVVEPANSLEVLKNGSTDIKMEDIGHDVPDALLYSHIKDFLNSMDLKQERLVRKSIQKIFLEQFESGPLQEGWKQNLATGLALTAGSFGALKGQDQSHQNFSKTHQTSINSNIESQYFYSAILGYLDQHGEELVNNSDDKMKTIMLKKEVMNFCEAKRDGGETKKLSREGFVFFNQVANLTKESGNIQTLIQIGQNIKH